MFEIENMERKRRTGTKDGEMWVKIACQPRK
jgi:hypothetical protein